MSLRIGMALACAWSLTGAIGQTRLAVSEKDFLADMPVVLSVSRLPQRLDETPGAVTILDRNTIRLSGARDVADLLRLVPGFRISNSFESNAPQGSYHISLGTFSNHIQVLVDGRSVYSPYLQGSTGPGLQTVALEDIERIEVLRGSNSAAYGARAFLGVVNIVTLDPLETLGVQAQVSSGENGIQDALVRLGLGDERASFRVGVDRRTDWGLVGASGPNRVTRFNTRADLHPTASDQIELRAGQTVLESGVGYSTLPGDDVRVRRAETSFFQLDWYRNLGLDSDLALKLSRTQELSRDNFPYLPIPGVVVDYGGRATSDNLSLQHTFRQGPDLRMVWGGELRREAVSSRPIYNTDAEFVNDFARLFGNAEWRLNRNWLLNAGGMLEHSNIDGHSFSPRLMLNWHFAEGQTLRYGVSQAFRPPSAFEKFSNVRYYLGDVLLDSTKVARGGVKPEKILAREIGYLGYFPELRLNLDVRIFDEEVRGFINKINYNLPGSGVLDSNAIDYVNSENFNIRGIEYQLKWQPWRGGQLVLGQSFSSSDQFISGNYPKLPFASTSLMVTQKLPGGMDLSVMYQQVDPTHFAGVDLPAPAMSRTDLRLAMPLRLGAKRGEVSLVVQNLGPSYQDYLPETYFRRQAYLTLKLEN